MKFEGHQVNIPIKGIMRAGTDNLCADGAMNEVIGMEYKDGSWLPYINDSGDIIIGSNLNYITKSWVHKLSDGNTKKRIFLVNDSLYHEDSEEGDVVSITYIVDGVKDVSFMGNMLCVSTNTGNRYFLWKNTGTDSETGEPIYVLYEQHSDECPNVSLRVTAGLYDENESNRIGMRYMEKIYIEDITDTPLSPDTDKNSIISTLIRAKGIVTEKGGLTGYVLACAAVRLKNGSLRAISAPVLLGRPMQKHGSESDGYKEVNLNGDDLGGSAYLFDVSDDSTPELMTFIKKDGDLETGETDAYALFEMPQPGDLFWEGATDPSLKYKHLREGEAVVVQETIDGMPASCVKNAVTNQGVLSDEYIRAIAGEQTRDTMKDTNRPYIQNLSCSRTKLMYLGGSNNKEYLLYSSYASSNKLQFKLSNVPVDLDNTDIASVCIFISPEISPYDLSLEAVTEFDKMVYNTNSEFDLSPTSVLSYTAGVMSYTAKYRSEEKIVDDIENIKSLYLVKEIMVNDIEDSSDWEDVDLKGLLGDTLVTRETLPASAFDKTNTIAEHLDTYNYRLHEYDYMQQLFDGYSIQEYKHYAGDGQPDEQQYPATTPSSPTTIKWEIFVNIKDNDGSAKVVKYDNTEVETIPGKYTPYISYPSAYADSIEMHMYVYISGESNLHFSKTLTLKHNYSLGISYYLDPELLPVYLTYQSGSVSIPENVPTELPYGNERNYRNAMKVSDVSYPSYFPIEYTYRIGNENIIGVARLTMPVSQDNFGTYALIAFCTDGIYMMGVDTTGNGAYKTMSFFSNEICINRNTICEIGGAVVFAGDKGLMLLTADGVEEFLPHLNGGIHFKPSSAELYPKDGQHIYNKLVTDSNIVPVGVATLPFKDALSTQDFIQFLSNSATCISYINSKNKLLIYNGDKNYTYFVDIKSRNATKLYIRITWADDNHGDETFYSRQRRNVGSYQYRWREFNYLSEQGTTTCLIQSRPIKIQQDDKCSYRLVLTGYFEGASDSNKWAELVVLGSIDGDHWKVTGYKERKLNEPFHNFGCITDRDSWKYLMFIFIGQLSSNSHIDSIDLTVDGRYNNKKR